MTTAATSRVSGVRASELRVGDRVRVRSHEDILRTLDNRARAQGLPFMPEMLQFAGRELTVDAVVHRTCDTVKTSGSSGTTRGMDGTVHLAGARCDGSAHGGCQAGCLLYWREDWLEPADGMIGDSADGVTTGALPEVLHLSVRGEGHQDDDPAYSCQATEILKASCFVSARNPNIWLRDVRSKNATAWMAVRAACVVAFNKWQAFSRRLPQVLRLHHGASWPWFDPTGERRREPPLDLRPGELVEVRSKEEIEATLDDKGALRGLRFSAEMLPYCGRQARVLNSVDKIIDEKSGRMLRLRDCIILDDVWCEGTNRLLCRRKIYLYWREAWLRRVDEAAS